MFLLKKRYWIIVVVLLTTFLLVKKLPATWVVYGVQQALPGFQVSDVSGSLWSGKAMFSQWVGGGQTLPLGQLHWEVQALSVLTLNPCVAFSAETSQQLIKGHACYALFSGITTLRETTVTLPIALVSPYFNIDLEGQVDAYIKEATLHQNKTLGNTSGKVLWRRASLYTGSEWVFLGDIQALFHNEENHLVSQWSSVDAAQNATSTKTPTFTATSTPSSKPVDIDLKLVVSNWAASQPKLKVNGFVKLGPKASGLQSMLRFIGELTDDGRYRIDLDE